MTKTPTAPRGGRRQTNEVKPRGTVQAMASQTPARRQDESLRGCNRSRIDGCNLTALPEPPDTDPYVRWCEGEAGACPPAPYSILPVATPAAETAARRVPCALNEAPEPGSPPSLRHDPPRRRQADHREGRPGRRGRQPRGG